MEGDQPGGVKQCVKHLQGERELRVGLEEVSLPEELCNHSGTWMLLGSSGLGVQRQSNRGSATEGASLLHPYRVLCRALSLGERLKRLPARPAAMEHRVSQDSASHVHPMGLRAQKPFPSAVFWTTGCQLAPLPTLSLSLLLLQIVRNNPRCFLCRSLPPQFSFLVVG